jgi:hypothetical protein
VQAGIYQRNRPRNLGALASDCQAWVNANYDFAAYDAARVALSVHRLARPVAPLLRPATATSPAVYSIALWPLYLQQTAEWVARSHGYLERLGRTINLPRYWVTAKVPALTAGGMTLYPNQLMYWLTSAVTGSAVGRRTVPWLVNLWRSAAVLPRGEGGVSVAGGFRPALTVTWSVADIGSGGLNPVYWDPFTARGVRGGEWGEVHNLRYPNAPAMADMVENMLRFVEGTPPDAMIKYAGDEFQRVALDLLSRIKPTETEATRAKVVAAVSGAAGVLAAIPGAQAYAAIVGALAFVLGVIPFAVAERTWCQSLVPVPEQLHYTLCHLGYPNSARGVPSPPDPYINAPPESCGGVMADTGVFVPIDPRSLLNAANTAPPANNNVVHTSNASAWGWGLAALLGAVAAGLAIKASR